MDKKLDFRGDSGFKIIDAAKVNNFASVAIIVCVVIAAVLSMGNVSFTFQQAISVSTLCIILFVVASLVYKTKYSEYTARAMQTESYQKAEEEYAALVKTVQERELLGKLPDLCQRYVEMELKQYRTAVLSSVCIPYSTYAESYMHKTKKELKEANLNRAMIRAVRKADRAKVLRLTPQGLLSSSRQSFLRFSVLTISSGERERIDTAFNTVSRLITTILGGAVAVEVIFDFSWQAIAQWVLRMLPIAVAAFSGAQQGTRNIEQTAIPHRKAQSTVLTTMLEWEASAAKSSAKSEN